MAYWLAKKREGQDIDFIQRFDPPFWTVDFPRPMMASVITTAPDALRVDCEFHHHDALAGLIWESEDRFDHPLLSYDTERDYSRLTLNFRWQSSGVLPLDAVHGPTLTIEGRDASGAARTWFVRLWNYADGTPEDARITIPFSDLREGWAGDGTLIHPASIDRMFISIVPPAYDPANSQLLPARADGWVELSDISADGERAMLVIGDALLPPHDVGMCTAYDDSYNLTPARMLRNVLHLGYRGTYVHYVGMSHYYRLKPDATQTLLVDPNTPLCEPCIAWHRNLFEASLQLGLSPILSLSLELFDEHCPEAWKQRDWDGNPALTGWVPPSTLVSPANNAAVHFLRDATTELVSLQVATGLDPHFQIGEPWWWINPGGKPCIYDADMRASQPQVPQITASSDPNDPAISDYIDAAAFKLGFTATSMRGRAQQAGGSETSTYILLFTPQVFDPAHPVAARLNISSRWSSPAFTRLQVEDYDWLTAGAEAERKRGYAALDARLAYPVDRQHYLAGFVLNAEDAEDYWRLIDGGLDEAKARGVERTFVWALPQIVRDGYVRLPDEENDVQSFDDVLYPLALGRDASVAPEFSTSILLTASGHERRNSQWSDARLNYDVGPGIRSQAELGVLLEFFRARRGPARAFRLADPFDFSSNGLSGTPTMMDQLIGTGDGLTATFQLSKSYGAIDEPQLRNITRPRADTILISVDGVAETDWLLGDGGRITFTNAPPDGAAIRAGFLFDVPVRFAEDRLDISGATFAANDAPSVPLIEVREDI
ncbi:DUF2460 domain-containing protein [Aurantiacibacter sediminis]|uniref:DUF2460 domain-containing protein n=1 Tax=Aurantiacibacter sediminis TaxID=2793064 RepID=A0ABS0N0R2_9SPHN|nr:DUF2460 domain-containing protein [Aurantiacibacter sediminis]MBH5321549.1 DUF2460 domain-containing protein [Aurantiacibacter sediminis]